MENADKEFNKEKIVNTAKKIDSHDYPITDHLDRIASYSKSVDGDSGEVSYFISEFDDLVSNNEVSESDLIHFFNNPSLNDDSIIESINLISRKHTNILSPKLVEALVKNQFPQVRYDALQIIADKKMKAFFPKLSELLNHEKNEQVRNEISLTLQRLIK